MSGRRALLVALRKVVGSRQTGMIPKGMRGKWDASRRMLLKSEDVELADPAMAGRLNTAAERLRTGALKPSLDREAARRRTNASPISVVDNEFDAPVRAAASSPSLPPAAALQAMPMARLKALFESYMGEPLARRSLTTRKDIIFEMEERARALDAADTIKRHS